MSMLLRALLAWIVLTGIAQAHDIYNGVKVHGFPCCGGGDGPNADCEPLELDQIRIGKGTDIRIFSKRYNAWILLPYERIQWMVLPQDPLARPGHYCGVPRSKNGMYYDRPTDADQPDPLYWSYCIFLTPGGS